MKESLALVMGWRESVYVRVRSHFPGAVSQREKREDRGQDRTIDRGLLSRTPSVRTPPLRHTTAMPSSLYLRSIITRRV